MNNRPIKSFTGQFNYLSNFYLREFKFGVFMFPSAEHAFQYQKCADLVEARQVKDAASPAEAKRLGRMVELRDDWEEVKEEVMLAILRCKFKDPELRQRLQETEGLYLEEGNAWGDREWGVCQYQGKNLLGLALMRVRAELTMPGGHPK